MITTFNDYLQIKKQDPNKITDLKNTYLGYLTYLLQHRIYSAADLLIQLKIINDLVVHNASAVSDRKIDEILNQNDPELRNKIHTKFNRTLGQWRSSVKLAIINSLGGFLAGLALVFASAYLPAVVMLPACTVGYSLMHAFATTLVPLFMSKDTKKSFTDHFPSNSAIKMSCFTVAIIGIWIAVEAASTAIIQASPTLYIIASLSLGVISILSTIMTPALFVLEHEEKIQPLNDVASEELAEDLMFELAPLPELRDHELKDALSATVSTVLYSRGHPNHLVDNQSSSDLEKGIRHSIYRPAKAMT